MEKIRANTLVGTQQKGNAQRTFPAFRFSKTKLN